MRTIRLKVYKFKELSADGKSVATVEEAVRFHLSITGRMKKEFNHHELEAARERVLKYKYEFKADGTRF